MLYLVYYIESNKNSNLPKDTSIIQIKTYSTQKDATISTEAQSTQADSLRREHSTTFREENSSSNQESQANILKSSQEIEKDREMRLIRLEQAQAELIAESKKRNRISTASIVNF